jgi:DNA-binding transcriptional LysR family regulator
MQRPFNKVRLIRQLDLFTLKLFLTTLEEHQVGRAAVRENVAASAATKRIQDLEEIMGIQLLERNARGVLPTPAGLVLQEHVKRIFDTLEEVRRDIGEFTDGVRGNICVASTGGIIAQFLASEIAEFARSYPMITIDLREYTNPEVVRALATGEVDVSVYVDTPEARLEEIDAVEYCTNRLVAVVSQDHELAVRKSVKVVDLLEHNLIAIAPSTTAMGLVRQAALQNGIEFKPKYSVNSVYAATSLVRMNQGVTIQPEGLLLAQDLQFVRELILDEPWAERHICVATQRRHPPTVAMQSFIGQLTSRVA